MKTIKGVPGARVVETDAEARRAEELVRKTPPPYPASGFGGKSVIPQLDQEFPITGELRLK